MTATLAGHLVEIDPQMELGVIRMNADTWIKILCTEGNRETMFLKETQPYPPQNKGVSA